MVAAVAAGIAVVLVALVAYFVVRHQLRSQVDNALRAQGGMVQRNLDSLNGQFPMIPASAGGPAPYVQVVLADGSTLPVQGGVHLPVTPQVTAVAGGGTGPYMTDLHAGDNHLRELVVKVPAMYNGQPVAVQLARPLNYVDHTLSNLRLILIILCLGGI